jgi:transitional endoplasmic reticulum ATPase
VDAATLQTLIAAHRAAPDNLDLLHVLLQAMIQQQELESAYMLIEDRQPLGWPADSAARQSSARVAIAMGDGATALRFFQEGLPSSPSAALPPTSLILRAEAHALCGNLTEGLRDYEDAITANPTLENPDLHRKLTGDPSGKPPSTPERRAGTQAEDHEDMELIQSMDDTLDDDLSRLLAPAQDAIKFDQVGGHTGIKEQIRRRIILPFAKPSLFQRFRKRVGGGILLYGPPGCGKTLLARATAGECEASFYNVAISDVLDMYIGASESRLRAIFERARATAPSVIFFDEIEALGGSRHYARESTSAKLVSQFLSEMDGFARDNHGVLVLGATNVPWAVDAAFRRPGRFDRVLFVPPPDAEAREAILRILLEGRPVAQPIDYRPLIRGTSSFSGADLQNLVETAADEAIQQSLDSGEECPITQQHLLTALREVKPTTLEWLTTARNHARYSNEGGQYNEVLDFLKQHGKS